MVRVYNPPPLPTTQVVNHSFSSNGVVTTPTGPEASSKSWGRPRVVLVHKEEGVGLGISIVGGKVETEDGSNISGIFIKKVIPDSPAGKCGQLFTGDRILEIGDVALTSSDQSVAVKAIKSAGDPIRFLVQGLQQAGETPLSSPAPPAVTSKNLLNPSYGQAQKAEENSLAPTSGMSTPGSENLVSPGSPEVVQPGLSDLERQVLQQKIQAEIVAQKEDHLTVYKKSSLDIPDDEDLQSNIISTQYDLTNDKVKAKDLKAMSGSEASDEEEDDEDIKEDDINRAENFKMLQGDLIEVSLTKDSVMGLGLALSGHVDRKRMGTFICGIRPQSPAHLDGKLQPGDELLKVHSTVVRGRCHLNVSAVIKKLANDASVRIVALRNTANHDKMAVSSFTHFPLILDEVIFGSSEFDAYLARREIKMQKTTEGLGLMIIEGSHKVLGKGIFVSDIQQNSLAYKAKLKVGDMILACNTESFLGITQDEATTILKNVTGNVRILVVNPTDEVEKRTNAPSPQGATPEKTASTLAPGEDLKDTTSPAKSRKASLAPPQDVKSTAASPVKAPDKSPAKTPAKSPGKSPAKGSENKIDIKKENANQGLGIILVEGVEEGQIFIQEIIDKGAAHKEGHLKAGDQVVSINGTEVKSLKSEKLLNQVNRLLYGSGDKVSITIEPKPDDSDNVSVITEELLKKAGKGIGLCVANRSDKPGVIVSELVPGGAAEMSGKIFRGDHVCEVNSKDVSGMKQEEVVALMKSMPVGGVKLKLNRYGKK